MAARRHRKTVKQAIDEIGAFHEIGRWTLRDFPDHSSGGKGKSLAAKLGMTLDHLEKSRVFYTQFSELELNRLYREIELDGFPVGVQHIVRLLRLPKNRRWKFLRETIEQKWSCRQLASAIQQATGRRPRTGRTPTVKDRAEAVQKLLRLCEEWQRLYKVILGSGKSHENGDGTIVEALPPSLNEPIRQCDEAIQRLYRTLGRFRKV
ncbi:MAG: hypothetical protein ABSB74_06570 [Tepidisphaeraceae bacterium]|jgi:hypothetical protein